MVTFSRAFTSLKLLSLVLKLSIVYLDRKYLCKSITLEVLRSDPKKGIYVSQ